LEIVKQADLVRVPEGSFTFDLKVVFYKSGKEQATAEFEVAVKDRRKSLVKFTSPKSERGKVMLMIGETLWIYIPTTRRPLRISPQQRLIGRVSNGDVARANFGEDYNAEVLNQETIEGKECYVLELTAKTSAFYSKVRYWVEKQTYRPVKAEFVAISGKTLKTAYYEGYKEMAGRMRPTRTIIHDALNSANLSEMTYSKMEKTELSDRLFQKDYLPYVR
jgi:outer membrane lipoprotein-sorting protein